MVLDSNVRELLSIDVITNDRGSDDKKMVRKTNHAIAKLQIMNSPG